MPMSDAKDPKKGQAEAVEPPKAGGSKVLPLLVGVNSLLLVAVLGFLALQLTRGAGGHAAAEPEKKAEEKEKAEPKKEEAKAEGKEGEGKEGEGKGEGKVVGSMGPMLKIPDFVIHLRNPEVDRYARMSFDIECYGESDKERLNQSLPKVRDAFIGYLSDRTVEDLRGSDGLSRTKDALQGRLRELVPEARVRALYISDFVVQ